MLRALLAAPSSLAIALTPVQALPLSTGAGRAVLSRHASYDALTARFFANMTIQPSAPRKALLATMETCLESHGLLAVFDYVNVYNGEDVSQNVVNAIEPSKKLTVAGSGSFSGLGWTGAGGYMFYPESLGAGTNHFSLYAATIGVWWNGTVVGNSDLMGTASTSQNQLIIVNSASVNARLGNSTTGSAIVISGEHDISAVRSDSTTLSIYANVGGTATLKGVSSSSVVSDASVSPVAGAVGTARGAPSTMTIAASWSGGFATPTNLTDLHNCLLPVLSSTSAQ